MLARELQDKNVDPITATIAISTTTSDAIVLYGTTAIAFQTPAALTGVAFTFLGSLDAGATFKTIKDQTGAAISFVVAADGTYPMDANTFAPYDQIKIVSGSTEAAERLIIIKPFAI